MKLRTAMLLAVGLSRALRIPQDSGFWSQHRNNSGSALVIVEPFNDGLINLTVAPAGDIDAWPPLPINLAPGFGLEITVTQLGPVVAQSQAEEIMKDIDDIYLDMSREGDPMEAIGKAYARGRGIVTVFFGRKPDARPLIRAQLQQVVNAIFRYSLDHGFREILVSEVGVDGKPVATFAMRFSEAEH